MSQFNTFAMAVGLSTSLGAFSSPALAASTEDRAFAVERLRVSLDRDGLLGVEWGTMLPHLSWDAGLWAGYADNSLVLIDPTGHRLGSLLSTRVGGSVFGTVGVLNWLQVGAELPLVFFQDRPDNIPGGTTAPLQSLRVGGFGDVRLVPKVQVLSSDKHGVDLAVLASLTVPTGGAHDYLGSPDVTFSPEVAVSRAFGPFRVAGNLAFLLRKEVTVVNLQVANELDLRLGAGYRFNDNPAFGLPLELDAMLAVAVAAKCSLQDERADAVGARCARGVHPAAGLDGLRRPGRRFEPRVRHADVAGLCRHTPGCGCQTSSGPAPARSVRCGCNSRRE